MSQLKPIQIVGGGLAGLALGIGLRRQDLPVTIWEAGHYPRHRVCGEFLSGHGLETLERLGLLGQMRAAGAVTARTAAFHSRHGALQTTLPAPALCLSRHRLDTLLAEQFRREGGNLLENQRWTSVGDAEGVVWAAGRTRQSSEHGWRLFGIKAHARNLKLSADIEMHFLVNGYVGICRVEDGLANVCGLFRSRTAIPDLGMTWRQWLCGPEGSLLNDRLARADFDDASFCSVAGLSLKVRRASDGPSCRIGDAISMIPPVTGNGMSMALESAELAMAPLIEYSRGAVTWETAARSVQQSCDVSFTRRLRFAAMVQRVLFWPPATEIALFLAARVPSFWNALFTQTRLATPLNPGSVGSAPLP
jgi:2-polyprenyl-6-methoxyphenol hydroxylase-like FAD-dependent oxidoreductase